MSRLVSRLFCRFLCWFARRPARRLVRLWLGWFAHPTHFTDRAQRCVPVKVQIFEAANWRKIVIVITARSDTTVLRTVTAWRRWWRRTPFAVTAVRRTKIAARSNQSSSSNFKLYIATATVYKTSTSVQRAYVRSTYAPIPFVAVTIATRPASYRRTVQ